MKMLLRDISIAELSTVLDRNKRRSQAPYLTDKKIVSAARRLAKRNGAWDMLSRNLDTARDIPVIKRSDFRNYTRNGNRTIHQDKEAAKGQEMRLAILGLWLDHPSASVDYLQDLLWSYCDDWTWVMAAHESCAIDLGSSRQGLIMAEALRLFKGRIEEEVRDRVSAEIEKRIFDPFVDPSAYNWWQTGENNWNHVCNGNIISTAIYQIEHPYPLARILHTAINNMTYAVDGFADDGGCLEGPGYWGYGFGHFMYAAHALHLKTNGKINITTDDKIRRICEYPLVAQLEGKYRTTFADSSHGYIQTRVAMVINHFFDLPELYALCQQDKGGKPRAVDMHELALFETLRAKGKKVTGKSKVRDCVLREMGQVKMNGKPGKKQLIVAALAGNNGVPHNHNDIGSFIVYRNDRMLLDDPGGPVYTARTFSQHRYETVFCNSFGHSVPVINRKLQEQGSHHHGTLKVEGLNEGGIKTAVIDMTHAYPKNTVSSLIRTITLDSQTNELALQDDYEFDRKPKSLEEAFITYEQVRISRRGKSATIGPNGNSLTLSSTTPGKFKVTALTEESKEGHGDRVINRVTFTPSTLAKTMALHFQIA